MTLAKTPVLSFFTGAGMLDLGFLGAGFDVVWHNEVDPGFIGCFSHGMQSLSGRPAVVECTDPIQDTDAAGILRQAFPDRTPRVFGMIGGPPCPDFSVGGSNRGGGGELGRLTAVYVQRVLQLRPSFFVMENVAGLVSTARHREFLDEVLRSLDGVYCVQRTVLNALDYGAPQDRRRLFVVGFLDPSDAARWHWPAPVYPDARRAYPWPGTDPFGGRPRLPAGVPPELTAGAWLDGAQDLPNGREWFRPKSARFASVAEGDTARKSYKRLHRHRYSPTAAYGNNEVHLHPWLPRRLSVREALRLQTVPDAYELPPDAPLSTKFKTIGNGVPVVLARALADSIALALLPSGSGD